MEKAKKITLPIEIAFELTTDKPETSGLMSSLRDMGFEQSGITGNCTKVKYKGQFTGTSEDLRIFCKKVKNYSTKA